MAVFRVRRRRGAQQLDVHDADLAKRAGRALVAADERIRVTVDELGFAEAELGADATAQLSAALVAARRHLRDAFRLNRLNHEAIPGSADEVRARYLRIVELCELAEDELDEQTSALADRVARARHAPEIIAGVRADTERLRARIPHARETIERLAARYAQEALVHVETNVAEADQLLGFAEHSVGVGERRRSAGLREQANVALEASVASVRRAATLLDAVETFEVEALRAESTLAALVEASRRDLAAALEEPHSRGIANAIGELRQLSPPSRQPASTPTRSPTWVDCARRLRRWMPRSRRAASARHVRFSRWPMCTMRSRTQTDSSMSPAMPSPATGRGSAPRP